MKKVLLSLMLVLLLAGCNAQIEQVEPVYHPLSDLDPLDAPFVVQAPLAEWGDPRQQDACEEASVIMAVVWTQGIETISKDVAKALIVGIAEYENENYGSNKDTSSRDTLERLIQGYYNYEYAFLKEIADVDDFIEELDAGNVIIMPADGQALGNPNFSREGPEKHMILIKGYDEKRDQFITNDPGTRNGEDYKYSAETIMASLKNYKTTGSDQAVNEKEVIVVEPVKEFQNEL